MIALCSVHSKPNGQSQTEDSQIRRSSERWLQNDAYALLIDGAGYHVAARLDVPANITLIRMPPYAPELNPIENVWANLRGKTRHHRAQKL